MTELVAWDSSNDCGPMRVVVVERAGRAWIRIESRGRYIELTPGKACEAASGIDIALTRHVGRDGRLVRKAG